VVIEAPVVEIDAATSCTVNTPTFTVNGATVLNGTVSQTGGGAAHFTGTMTADVDVVANGVSLHNHKHSGVTAGGSQTGTPV
jgi:phage baseplate assembly protein V